MEKENRGEREIQKSFINKCQRRGKWRERKKIKKVEEGKIDEEIQKMKDGDEEQLRK